MQIRTPPRQKTIPTMSLHEISSFHFSTIFSVVLSHLAKAIRGKFLLQLRSIYFVSLCVFESSLTKMLGCFLAESKTIHLTFGDWYCSKICTVSINMFKTITLHCNGFIRVCNFTLQCIYVSGLWSIPKKFSNSPIKSFTCVWIYL